ncbi:uncharacterized protein LOC111394208 [Olea europaea var. sylvestris]|uniref:uncharacterized protein LOC111394208 n=1 Tax=Olea europaea var. sylvestris TaxID=158386 RepID=UPI000C1CEEE4|nr:uncharacterized protein LOC111394208 [Olea europaea var. sylvestris]
MAEKSNEEIRPEIEAEAAAVEQPKESGSGGWGGWGFSPLSYLSDLQKAATVAAEEISRNAVEVAKTAAKGITDMQMQAEESESSKDDETEVSANEEESEDENDKRRKLALVKLEKASEDSLLGQGLKVFDNSVESFTSGAWQALGSAWKEGATLVHKLENNASNLAESIQHGGQPGAAGSIVPSFIEDGLQELESLSNHYVLLYNRRKAKLSSEQKPLCDEKLKEVQYIFDSGAELDGSGTESEKGKKVEAGTDYTIDEMKNLHDSSIRKAAELAAGFTNALAGLAPNDIIQRTVGRLDSLQSEGVHRLSEMCCFAMTQLLVLGKSMISNANKIQDQEIDEDTVKIDWPEDSVEKAKIIRTKVQSMTLNVEAVSNSFITGISDVAEAYLAATKSVAVDSQELPEKSVQKKADMYSEGLRTGQSSAIGKIHDGLQYLSYIVLSTSISAA